MSFRFGNIFSFIRLQVAIDNRRFGNLNNLPRIIGLQNTGDTRYVGMRDAQLMTTNVKPPESFFHKLTALLVEYHFKTQFVCRYSRIKSLVILI